MTTWFHAYFLSKFNLRNDVQIIFFMIQIIYNKRKAKHVNNENTITIIITKWQVLFLNYINYKTNPSVLFVRIDFAIPETQSDSPFQLDIFIIKKFLISLSLDILQEM